MLDEVEFEMLFNMIPKNQAGKLQDGPMMKENVGEGDLGNYMQGGYNIYNKRPLDNSEMLQLPQFASSIRNKLEMRRRGKEVGRDNIPTNSFLQQ